MSDLKKLEKENGNIKDLLVQLYEMSGLKDMINEGCKHRNDDDFLVHNLILKSQIEEALIINTPQEIADEFGKDAKVSNDEVEEEISF